MGGTHAPACYAFRVEYLDRTDGKKYETKMYVAWDDYDEVWFPGFDEDWNHLNATGVKALQGYFYNEHTCPCHRKQDAASAGAVTDDECEGNRFQIVRIWDPNHPGLILYSETMTSEELEAHLREHSAVEPLYSDKDQPEPWFWHPDVQDIWWQVAELLRGTWKFHVITDTFHYATREAAIEDLKRAEALVEARLTRTHPCQ